MAGVSGVTITVKGRGGHGSAPEFVKDCISATCCMNTELQKIKSIMTEDSQNFVFSICTINAGSSKNVFPDECIMTGTIRFFDVEVLN